MRTLRSVAIPGVRPHVSHPRGDASLCAGTGNTCGACCWSPALSRAELDVRLRRHQQLFAPLLARRRAPGALAVLLHELRARRGADLLLAPLLWLPVVGPRLRGWIAGRAVCAFVAFLPGRGGTHVGCLLHPRRWNGRDVRQASAFRLLRGVGCGDPGHACSGAREYAAASRAERGRLQQAADTLDWHGFSMQAPAFAATPSVRCR